MLSEAPSIVKATSMSHPLDNPVWHALTGPHAQHAIGVGLARHYPRAMTPFSGIATETPAAYTDLSTNLPPNTEVRLFSIADKPPPDGWTAIDAFPMLQICQGLRQASQRSGAHYPECRGHRGDGGACRAREARALRCQDA
jgi:hypothetical protein